MSWFHIACIPLFKLQLDCVSDPAHSNWTKFINCARNSEEQNLVAFRYERAIYYRTVKSVDPGAELLVWYGDEYSSCLGMRSTSEEGTGDFGPRAQKLVWHFAECLHLYNMKNLEEFEFKRSQNCTCMLQRLCNTFRKVYKSEQICIRIWGNLYTLAVCCGLECNVVLEKLV